MDLLADKTELLSLTRRLTKAPVHKISKSKKLQALFDAHDKREKMCVNDVRSTDDTGRVSSYVYLLYIYNIYLLYISI